ncbi:MAG: hypothetical protein AAF791_07835 [Bacteroidota bacterium]
MRRLGFAFLLFSLAVSVAVSAQEAPLGNRLGVTVDAYERDYFRLFPEVEGFVSATLRSEGEDVVARITRASGDEEHVRIQSPLPIALERILTIYEDYDTASAQYAANLRAHAALAAVMAPVQYRVQPGDPALPTLTFSLTSGASVSGIVLFTSDDAVALWSGEGPFTLADLSSVRILPIDQVEYVNVPAGELVGLGESASSAAVSGIGSAVAVQFGRQDLVGTFAVSLVQGGLALVPALLPARQRATPGPRGLSSDLRRLQRFLLAPPELRALVGRSVSPLPDERHQARRTLSRLQLSVSGAGRRGIGQDAIEARFANGLGGYTSVSGPAPSGYRYMADVSYRVVPWASVGIDTGVSGSSTRTPFLPYESGQSIFGYLEGEIGGSAQGFLVSIALAGGLGLARQSASVEVVLPDRVEAAFPDGYTTRVSASASGVAQMGRAAVGFHPNDRVTLRLTVAVRALPRPRVEAFDLLNPNTTSPLRIIAEWGEVEGTSNHVDVSVGTRIGF